MKDGFGREISYLRLSATELCNLRCRYCMPADGVCKKRHEDMLSEDEMIRAIEAAASLGVTKLRVTGGEPLVKKNIVSLCARAAAVSGIEEVCLTTNGALLPDLAKPLRAVGVRRVNISLDTLDAAKYAYITRAGSLDNALRALDAALNAGFDRVKLNVVLIGGFNDDEIPALARLSEVYPVDVRFIELMPMYDGGDFNAEAFLSCDSVLKMMPELQPLPSDDRVAKLYRLPDGRGNIGLISPLSASFCGLCNRIRLTADGKIKPCLHSNAEFGIKGLDKAAMTEVMKRAILAKPACHPALSATKRSPTSRNMNQIGG